ncbi:hypothetical protein [Metaclostridioides mangenotii]|uniref:hypothetical protein n=1 Tax=Metaclostridioides mangenotii TaxID=1540 RepID=UPI0004652240|nr:hypothetical protein [Clostridioides mangenotii]
MKLTNKDKEILRGFGYPNEDFKQIERATFKKYTTYELNGENISLEKVLEIMDREEYLSGIARSAFHWSAVRQTLNEKEVYFNSSKLFK